MSSVRSRERLRPRPRGVGPRGEAGFGLVEVLVAVTILAVGLLAVAGLTWAVATQTREATVRTGQTLAAQQVVDAMVARGYEALATGSSDTTLVVGERSYTVAREVTQAGPDLKQVVATVSGAEGIAPRVFTTRVHRERALP